MKKILLPLATALAVLGSASASAASNNTPFNVKVDLTSVCSVVTAITDVQFTYTSFQAAAAPSSGGNFSVKCTTGLGYSFSFVGGAAGTMPTTGLTYTLTAPASGTGNGANQALQITGSMPGLQGGTCATAGGLCSDTDATKQLTITF